jgi:hypothetical protein
LLLVLERTLAFVMVHESGTARLEDTLPIAPATNVLEVRSVAAPAGATPGILLEATSGLRVEAAAALARADAA